MAFRATAAVLRATGAPPALEAVELDAPRGREVLVEMAAAGICHTDLAAAAGLVRMPLPVVLGHEGAGVVREVGPEVEHLRPGDHVVLTYDSCGACRSCAAARPAYCERFHALNHSGRRADGSTTMAGVHGSFLGQSSFATHALASERNAVRVPEHLPLEHLAPLGCGVQTGAGAVLNVLRPPPGSSLAVFGLGAVGLAAVMAARAAGCETIVGIDPLAERRALALELGATEALEAGEVPRGMDYTVEAVGSEAVVADAVRALASPGVCATVGFRGVPNPVRIDQGHLLFGRTLTGVIEGDGDPQAFIPRLVELGLPLDRLVTTFAFERLGEALDAVRAGTVVKAVLTFGAGRT
jgi:aryl-alcohol dehydrogenase